MSVLRFLVPALLATTLFAQTSDNAVPDPSKVIGQAFRPQAQNIFGAVHTVTLLNPGQPMLSPGSANQCAVPLVEMPIPPDNNFVITQTKPLQDFADNMPPAHALLACPPPGAMARPPGATPPVR